MEQSKLLEIARKSTPTYVYSLDRVAKQYGNITSALESINSKVFYAVKANANSKILETLSKLGCGAEAVSPGEVDAALQAGFTSADIMFTSSNITRKEFEQMVEKGVGINIDSLNQLEWYGEMRPEGEVSLRINKDVGDGHHANVITGGALSKFGIHHTQMREAKKITDKYNLKVVGLHQHIGSHVQDEHIYIGAMKILMDFASNFEGLKFLDFGGGFGVPYEEHEAEFDMQAFGNEIREEWQRFVESYGREVEFRFEPGRYLVAQAGVLVAEITDIKEHSGTKFVGLNTGFNHFVRPMMYDSYHRIENLSNPSGTKERVTVVGYVCESGDVFARERMLAKPNIGDIVVIYDTGAYGYSMSSNYNLREKPAEICI